MPEITSCTSNPFIKLGDPNKAPILDYSLPQETCYEMNVGFPLFVPSEYFKEECFVIPENNLFEKFKCKSIQEIINMLKEDILSNSYNCFLRGFLLKKYPNAVKIITEPSWVAENVLVGRNLSVNLQAITSSYITAGNTGRMSGAVKEQIASMTDTKVASADDDAISVSKGRLANPVTNNPPIAPTSAVTPTVKGLIGNALRINHLTYTPYLREQQIQVAGYTLEYLANKIAEGFLLVLEEDQFGRLTIRFLRKPPAAKPTIQIIEHHKMCSYLGNYGAGKVIKTFSLYPGEVTQITVRSFKDSKQSFYKDSQVSANEMSSTYYSNDEVSEEIKAESLLEGKSNYARNQVQKGIEDRTYNSESSVTNDSTDKVENTGNGKSSSFNAFFFAGSKGGGSSATTNTNATSSSMREKITDIFNYSVDDQVEESNSYRDLEVNTTTANSKSKTYGGNDLVQNTTTVSEGMHQVITTGEEATTVRYLRNINLSRTLNLVFRQMLQEFISVTFLNDASFVYTNGYPEKENVYNILTIDDMLEAVIKPAHISEVRKAIQLHFCNVFNYLGDKFSFIEKVTETYDDCESGTPDETYVYWRKKRGLTQTYTSGPINISVPGIITSVKHRTLKTDSAIVDALLGQGEALDCYNQKLQDEAVRRAVIENDRYLQETGDMHDKLTEALSVIAAITDPEAKAEAYRKMFNDCCLDDIKLILGSMCNHTTPPAE